MSESQPHEELTVVRERFVRDGLIFFYYAVVGFSCYITAVLGPIMPFLRSELALNYQVAGLHFSALAAGSVVAGSIGDRILEAIGQIRSLITGAGSAAAGLLLVTAAHHALASIAGVLLAGFGGSLVYQSLATIIADRLGDQRALAYMEAEVVAMLLGGLAPFAVGGFVRSGLGWRAALVLVISFFAVSIFFFKRFEVETTDVKAKQQRLVRLPPTFWAYGTVIFLSVAAEWSVAFWSADYLQHAVSLCKADAATSVGAFFVGMVAGRFGGSRLVREHGTALLLSLSAFVSIVGFLLFWLGHFAPINIAGLFLTGLGIANMYPLSFAAAVGAVPQHANRAVARLSLLCGVSILCMPFLLSLVADKAGLFSAYALVAMLLLLCLGAIFAANAVASRQESIELSGASS